MAKLDEKFIVNLKGKDFVEYGGLVDLAHQEGLISIEVDLLQIPTKENNMTAIAKATAKTDKFEFTDIGDASPASTNTMIQPHIIRMASTRAKARALRDLTNVGMTALEELGEEEVKKPNKSNKNYTKNNQNKSNNLKCSQCNVAINSGVETYSIKKFGKALCLNCQKKVK